ncbi:ABC transporter ATP-binding protein [Vagococcus sp. BWB3-3]|uniref:ABC transporter ATP-binding protein n=1 Tax=Vagococcus allomyrinae TaxID=2794353 RepID=A0A940SV90_9ENTE|nr:ABC transporter ATP-binding protein [Vagococcus allomyrinae]MBP1041609.1 ABC transporter ATP-binding protein [Vagococcus allomyrinae]
MKLVLETVTKKFDQKAIIEGASFEFEKGKIYGLLGRNGAGKTTLFNCISRNLQLDNGQIAIEEGDQRDDNYDNTSVGFVYATPHLPGFMTGYEFVKFFVDVNKERLAVIEDPQVYLARAGIESKDQHRLLKDYSHGMQNKVQMLVTMLVKSPVLLLDEPLTSFDVVVAHEMKELIISQKDHSVVIFSTHILQLAQDLCDEIVLLHEGKLTGIPSERIHDADFEEEVVKLLSTSHAENNTLNSILLQEGGQ